MPSERELIARHLRELLALVEDRESDLSEIRYLLPLSRFDRYHPSEVLARLRHIERHLEELVQQRCAFAQSSESGAVMHYITGLVGREREERKHITSWLAAAEQIIVVDPYFFSFSGPNKIYRTQAQYITSIVDLLPTTLRSIEIFHLPGPNRAIFSSFQKHCQRKGISLKHWATTEVHDRVLIKSESDAKALGTSFGGLGNKIAFVLDLPQEDLNAFRRQLHRIKSEA